MVGNNKSWLMMDSNMDHCSKSYKLLNWLLICGTIDIQSFPVIIPSPINHLVQPCIHLHKCYGRDILAWLLVTLHQTMKWDIPLIFFGFKPHNNSTAAHTTKNRKLLNNHPIARAKAYDLNVTRKQKDERKKNVGNEQRIFDLYW